MALGVRDDSAACAVGWIPLPPELRGEGIDFGLLVALIDEEYRKEFSSYTSKQAALSMRGARRRSLEVQMTAPRYGHVVGFLAVIAVPARLYVLGGLALSKVMPQYRSEFERIFESVFCSA
jgi:hypothetical protein